MTTFFSRRVRRLLALVVSVTLPLIPLTAAPAPDKEPPGTAEDELHPPRPRTGPLNPPAPPKFGEPVNDKATLRFLEAEGLKLVEANRTLTDWRGELGRKTCQLKLPSAGTRKLSVADAAKRAESAVVIVGTFYLCKKCPNTHLATASGFFLTETGALATSRHVLGETGRGVVVLTRGGRLCAVKEVLAADPLNDLIILQVEGKGFTALPLATRAELGAAVTLVSHPENHFFTLTTGVVSRRFAQRRKDGVVELLAITAEFAKGSSGAPVCNESGAVIALANNTESIYYNVDRGHPVNFQMAMKNCTPAQALLDLIKPKEK